VDLIEEATAIKSQPTGEEDEVDADE
jgi:hypothetical protein